MGNYSDYVVAHITARVRQQAQWTDQQAYIERVAADIQRVKQQGQVNPHSPAAKKAGRKAKAREHKLERYVESDERVNKVAQSWGLKLDFSVLSNNGCVVLQLEHVRFGYPRDGYRGSLLHDVSFEVQYGERVALIGPNGVGKSTLLRLVTGQLQPDAGRVRLGTGVQVGYLTQEQETLNNRTTVLDSLRMVVPWSVTGGTILAVAHDRYFLTSFAERVLALHDGQLVDYPGGYTDFERDAAKLFSDAVVRS